MSKNYVKLENNLHTFINTSWKEKTHFSSYKHIRNHRRAVLETQRCSIYVQYIAYQLSVVVLFGHVVVGFQKFKETRRWRSERDID